MGLDCYVKTAENVTLDSSGKVLGLDVVDEIGYWRKCWVLHEFFANYYQENVDEGELGFNCVYMLLNLDILLKAHKNLCDVANEQHLSFDKVPDYDVVDTNDINTLKKCISYLKENPNQSLVYYGWY